MRCPRCGGVMDHEWFTNMEQEGMSWSYDGWRCIYCGEVIDPLILYNRLTSKGRMEETTAAGAHRGRNQ